MVGLDFDAMRKRMVEEQLVARNISDKKVLDVFRKVPRHSFIPEEYAASSYGDFPLPIGYGQTISQPFMVALMTQCLALKGEEHILEIGTGSGYQAAILSELSREVCTIERVEALAQKARDILDNLGYTNYKLDVGDGTIGWHEHAPYDGILVTAGAPAVPDSLVRQLRDGGRLVIPVGNSFGQTLTIVERHGGFIKKTEICGCVFVPLIGKEGWSHLT